MPGTWDYQVIMHEFSHLLKTGRWEINDKDVKVMFESSVTNGEIVNEALNSIFAVRMYDKTEQDIAYQLQSNYFQIILDCLDNYSLTDYINHSFTYLEQKLNEYMGNEDAVKMMTLLDVQYKDYHNPRISFEQEEFYPLYDYIASMYCNKYINANMSYTEAKEKFDNMIYRITYDVDQEYNIDTNHFYDFFNNYCSSLGISTNYSR